MATCVKMSSASELTPSDLVMASTADLATEAQKLCAPNRSKSTTRSDRCAQSDEHVSSLEGRHVG